MPHVLQQVRDAAVTAVTGLTTTGARVYTAEPYPWQAAQVPGLVLATSAAPLAEGFDAPATLSWNVTLDVDCIVRGTGDLAALLDTIASEIQVALCALVTVGGVPVQVNPVSLEAPQWSGEGDQPIARRRLSFSVFTLYTVANAPDVLLA